MKQRSMLLCEQEMEALAGLPHSVAWLYVQLRWRMDYASGLVGAVRRISWRTLGHDLYVEPAQGRAAADSGAPSERALRCAVALLERVGLVVRQSGDRQLIFALPMALVSARALEVGQERGGSGEDEAGRLQTSVTIGFVPDVGQQCAGGEGVEVGSLSGVRGQELRSYLSSSSCSTNVSNAREPAGQAAAAGQEWAVSLAAMLTALGLVRVDPSDVLAKPELRNVSDAVWGAAAEKARRQKKGAPIRLNYVLPIVADMVAGLVGVGPATTGSQSTDWFLSASGIEAKAAELGYTPPADVPLGLWRLEVYRLAGLTPAQLRAAQVDQRG
ncbi:hypothetical protein ACTSKR_07605 [Chitinibacteraceae bacterium HSL-7]